MQTILTPYPAEDKLASPVSTRVNTPADDAPADRVTPSPRCQLNVLERKGVARKAEVAAEIKVLWATTTKAR